MLHRLLSSGLIMPAVLTVVLAGASRPALANQDAVQFFQNIHVAQDDTVHDAVCFFCNVDIEGKSTGDVVVFFGGVHIRGEAAHDVVNFFGAVKADEDSSIQHDLVSFFGYVDLGKNVRVGKDMVTMFGASHREGSATVGGSRVSFPLMIVLGPVGLIVLIFWAIAHSVRERRHAEYWMNSYPGRFPPSA
jgi:hypothetical protein